MGTDRYSDNHKIVVNNGSGELEFSVGNFKINSDTAQTTTANTFQVTANTFQLEVNNCQISSDSNTSINSLQNCELISSQDINLTTGNDINIEVANDFYGAIGDDFSLNVTNQATIRSDIITLQTNNDLFMNVGDDLTIITNNDINISSDNIAVACTGNIDLTGSSNVLFGGQITAPNDGAITLSGESDNTNSYVVVVENTAASANADILKLSLPNVNIDWIDSGTQIVFDPALGSGNNFIAFYASGTKIAEIEGVIDQVDSTLQNSSSAGISGVRFVNGSPSDFAEWLRVENINDWGFSQDVLELISKQKKKILPIPEGTVVYIRNNKIQRSSPGTPMIVSRRAAFVGNSSQIYEEFGAIISFCGQVPVLTSGPVNDGDYLLPADGENYCFAVSKDKITFDQYKMAVGTSWESNQSQDKKKVNCAIGIK